MADADARSVSFDQVGDEDGFPVIYHNGTPCSRLLPTFWDAPARDRGLRILCFDRPGYGRAPAQPGRTVADEVRRTAAMLDDLGVERFATWGASGGGPYALGCGALLPDRVVALGVVAGNAPFDQAADPDGYKDEREALADGGGRDRLLATYEADAAPMRRWDVDTLLAEWGESFSPQDKQSVGDGETGAYLLACIQEAIRESVAGWLDDNLAYVKPWGFALDEIRAPVSIWHGDDDLMVPLTDGRAYESLIPQAELTIAPGWGHPSLIFRHTGPLFDWLAIAVV
jgi:pimeloyl-ACP methyl ester carboxylesterase